MNPTQNTTPAGRVYAVFLAIQQSTGGDQLRKVLASYFDIPHDSPELLYRVADLHVLLERCKADVTRVITSDSALYIGTFDQARTYLQPERLGASVEQLRRELEQRNLITLLQFCRSTFEQHDLWDGVDDERFREWSSSIASLLAEIETAEMIDPQLREYLHALLTAFMDGALAARVRGATAVRDELDILIARLLKFKSWVNRDVEEKDKDKRSSVVAFLNKALSLAKSIDEGLSATISIYEKGKKVFLAAPTALALLGDE